MAANIAHEIEPPRVGLRARSMCWPATRSSAERATGSRRSWFGNRGLDHIIKDCSTTHGRPLVLQPINLADTLDEGSCCCSSTAGA